MRSVLLFILIILGSITLHAQNKKSATKSNKKPHKIVYQLTNSDPETHKALMRQLGHVFDAAPDTKIEVVCHGPGLDILVKEKTTASEKIAEFKSRGVVFYACENTMKQKNIEKAAIVPEVDYVAAGIIHIVERQEKGWSYIKAGF